MLCPVHPTYPIITISLNISDFVDVISESSVPDLKGLSHSTQVKNMGIVEWTVYNVHHSAKTIWMLAFCVPDARITLRFTDLLRQRWTGALML